MTTSITLDEIIEVFLFHKPELKMQEIKDYVFDKHNGDLGNYKHRESFNQTIQDIVQSHCEDGDGYNGIPVFQKIRRAYYRLQNHEAMAEHWNPNSGDTTNEIIKLVIGKEINDIELTARTLREVNIINRDKRIVFGLKQLYADTCQICNTKLQIAENLFYSEVHHVKPLGEPHNGPDIATNMIVVCPNCHVLLDFKAIEIIKDKIKFKDPHKLDDLFIDYHNKALE